MKKIAIYGAKAIAFGIYTAVKKLYPQYPVTCFLVNSLLTNSPVLAGIPVREIAEFSSSLTEEEKRDYHILIGTPEDIHPEIIRTLEQYGFSNYTCMDSRKEAALMERYFTKGNSFPSLHGLTEGKDKAEIQVFMAKFYKDKQLKSAHQLPDWLYPLQVGAAITDIRVADETDNAGDNISGKNVNYCELTALYWIWKNRLLEKRKLSETEAGLQENVEYYGLFHYRRILDIKDEDLLRLRANEVDAILQFPTLHEPDISEHHARYLKEADWEAMLHALRELQPEYAEAFPSLFSQPYFYNYNLIIAKRNVLADYCAWLFPILERTEELSRPKGGERADRYIGYLGENLMTLYFLYNRKRLRIYHTGRLMLT